MKIGSQVLREVAGPRKRWGPALPENRTGRYSATPTEAQPIENGTELDHISTLTARQESYDNKGCVIEDGVHEI